MQRITTTDIARIPGRCCKQPAVRLVVLTVRLRQLLRHEKWKRLEAHRARTVNAVVIAVAPLETAFYLHTFSSNSSGPDSYYKLFRSSSAPDSYYTNFLSQLVCT